MNGLVAAVLAWLGRVASDALARIVADWRRDRALVEKGAAEEVARANAATAEAERRAAAVPKRDEAETIADLEKGEF